MGDEPSSEDLAMDDELHTTMESEVDAVIPKFDNPAAPTAVDGDDPPTMPGTLGEMADAPDDDDDSSGGRRGAAESAPPRPASKRSPSSGVPRPRSKPTPLGLKVPASVRPLSEPPRPMSSRPPSRPPPKAPSRGASSRNPTPISKPPEKSSPKSVPPTIDESDWLAPRDVAPEGMFASGDYAIAGASADPFAQKSEAPGLDSPTVKMNALRDLELGAYDDPNDDGPPPAEESFDGAKTQKLHRPDLDELRRLGAEVGLVEKAEADDLPAADGDEPIDNDSVPDGVVDLAEDIDEPTMVLDSESQEKPKKRSSRRGRKRRAMKIPDDATPLPPQVTLAEMASSLAEADRGLDDEPVLETSDSGAAPQSPPARERLETLTGTGQSSPPPPMRREPDDEVTLLRPSPALRKALEASGAIAPEEAASHEGDEAPREPAPSSPELTPGAPGVMTDHTSIGLVRSVQVVSDLPAVEELKQRTLDAIGQGGPVTSDGSPDYAEEIDPEPPHPPGPPPATPAPGSADAANRRPPPPRRGTEPNLEAIEEIEPDRVSLPQQRQLPPPRSGEPSAPPATDTVASANISQAEADLALAEARARDAAVKAREAAARAAEADAKAKATPPKKPWWAEMFEGDLIRTLDNPRKLDVEKETSFIEQCLRLPKGSRVLDLACGNGVHAVELSSRGFQVVGVDYSDKMLDLARSYNNQRGASVSFIQGDMRKLNLEGVFDGIYCWSSSFGYFDEATNANVLERIARAVRPGGTFALDMDNRDFVAPRAPQMAWFEKPGVVCMDEMRFDYYSSRMITRRMAIFEDQAPREVETTIRLYTLRELGRLLQRVGFRILEVSGHRATRGAYFGDVSPRIIICCQRSEDD